MTLSSLRSNSLCSGHLVSRAALIKSPNTFSPPISPLSRPVRQNQIQQHHDASLHWSICTFQMKGGTTTTKAMISADSPPNRRCKHGLLKSQQLRNHKWAPNLPSNSNFIHEPATYQVRSTCQNSEETCSRPSNYQHHQSNLINQRVKSKQRYHES